MGTLTDSLHLEATERFIAENGVSVSMVRAPRVSDGVGGHTRGTPVTQSAITVRLLGIRGEPIERMTEDGKIVIATEILVAMPDADVRISDTFTSGGSVWEVLTVNLTPPWRLSAEVYRRG